MDNSSKEIDKKTPNFKKISIYLLKFGLGAIVIYIIIKKVDLNLVWNYMKTANILFLVLAFFSFFISKLFASFRINSYYRTINLNISERLNFKLNLFSMFYNLFIPLIGGEGYRVYWLNKNYKTPIKKLIWASVLDRVSGLSVLLILGIVFFQFIKIDFQYQTLCLLLIPLGLVLYYFIHTKFFKNYKSAWIRVNLFSLIIQLLQVATAYFILLALHIDSQIAEYLFVFLVSCLAYVLPFIGAREMAFVFGASELGLDLELSLAISLFFYLSLALSSFLGIYFLFFPKKLN